MFSITRRLFSTSVKSPFFVRQIPPIYNGYKLTVSNGEESVNFEHPYGNGKIEFRYVRKAPEYIASYLSSHNGCRLGCNMCHLTHNKDTNFKHVNLTTYGSQLDTICKFYRGFSIDQSAKRCNINFMSKGDALANTTIVNDYPKLYDELDRIGSNYGLKIKPNVSTIMPFTVRHKSLIDIFKDKPAYPYYSLYSVNEEKRKLWLPNAIPYQEALYKLKEYQKFSNNIITFHFAIINGFNDDLENANRIAKILSDYNFNAKFNLVRFNPHPDTNHTEAPEERIQEIFKIINESLGNHEKSYIVKRLNTENKIACGMFYKN